MQQITDWGAATVTAVAAGFVALMASLPTIVGALIVLIIGWIIAGWLGRLVAKLVHSIRLDTVADRSGINGFLMRAKPNLKASVVLGDVVKWVVRLIFLEMAADRLGFTQVTIIINQILSFIPNIIVAMVVLALGMFLGQIAAGLVRASASEAGIGNASLLANLAQGAIVAFAVIVALNEVNVAPVVVNTLFIGLVSALALALGLAFGLGGRETAAKYWQQWSSGLEANAAKAVASSKATTVYGVIDPDPTTSSTTPPKRTR